MRRGVEDYNGDVVAEEVMLAVAEKVDQMAKSIPVRLSDEAIRWARIASGYTGESMAAYVSRIVVERGKEDADRLHAQAIGMKPQPDRTPEPKRPKGPK